MLLRVYSGVLRGRRLLADGLALRWLRDKGVDLAAPFGALLVLSMSVDQFDRRVGPLPFAVAWLGLAGGLALSLAIGRSVVPPRRGRGRGRELGLAQADAPRASLLSIALLAQVLALWIVFDLLAVSEGRHLYDLDVYLGSAQRWLDGGTAYLTGPLTAWPDSPRHDFFLYPPPLLPLFGLLARLPYAAVATAWTAGMAACSYAAFRALGLRRSWSVALLAFPPVFIGFESGNVASLTFLLFALTARAGGALVVDVLFKVQSVVPLLWLIRERRFSALLAGAAAVAAIVLGTLPIVGPDAWRQWWDGLGYRAASQPLVPSLFGYSYARWLPPLIFAGAGVTLVALALAFRGRRGLAAFGLVSIFVSPSLWPHGFAFALPAVFLLESDVAVLAMLGTGAIGLNMWLLFYVGWLAILAARREPSGALHPLTAGNGRRRGGGRPIAYRSAPPHPGSAFPAQSPGMLEAQASGPSREEP